MTNLATNLTRTSKTHGERTALRLGEETVTYTQLDEASARAAASLRGLGIEPGDRVAIMLPNLTIFPVLYYGILRAGAVVVPMNPLLKAREVSYYLEDSGAKLFFALCETAHEATKGAADAGTECVLVAPGDFETSLDDIAPDRRIAERSDHDTAVILYTSGTTGKPKGAELTHANLGSNVRAVVDLFPVTEDDVIFGGLPLFHSFGQTCGLNVAVATGACLTLLTRFDAAAALEILQRDKVTVFEGVPTMYAALLQHPSRTDPVISTLRVCASGGRPCRWRSCVGSKRPSAA